MRTENENKLESRGNGEMKKNFRLEAREVLSTDQQGNRVDFYIADGCNGYLRIATPHDEVYVNQEALLIALQQIEEDKANGRH